MNRIRIEVRRALEALEGHRNDAGRAWRVALAVAIAGAVPYGLVLGSWTPRLAVYAAVKLPLVLLLTSLATFPFVAVVGRLLGIRLPASRIALLVTLPLAAGALILASLAPVAWLFTVSGPTEASRIQTTHNVLYLMHTIFVAVAGSVATLSLRGALRTVAPGPRSARAFLVAWLVTYAIVGGEVAWVLRPFVGSPWLPVEFLRPDALDGNIYELIVTDIIPHLLGTDEGES